MKKMLLGLMLILSISCFAYEEKFELFDAKDYPAGLIKSVQSSIEYYNKKGFKIKCMAANQSYVYIIFYKD